MGVIRFPQQGLDGLLVSKEIGYPQHHLSGKVLQGHLELVPNGPVSVNADDPGYLSRASAIVDGQGSLIVGNHSGQLMLDIVHSIGAEGVLSSHLQAGRRQVPFLLTIVVVELDGPLLFPLRDQIENGGNQLPVVLHPEHRGVFRRDGMVNVGSGGGIGSLQHGPAAGEQKAPGQCQGQNSLLHGWVPPFLKF